MDRFIAKRFSYEFKTFVASRRRLTSIFIISARLALNALNALFKAIGTSAANRSRKSVVNGNEIGAGLAMACAMIVSSVFESGNRS